MLPRPAGKAVGAPPCYRATRRRGEPRGRPSPPVADV